MNARPRTIPPPTTPGRSRNCQAAANPPGRLATLARAAARTGRNCQAHANPPSQPPLPRPLTRCPYCSPPQVYLGGLWVPLPPELAGATFTDGICPLHLAEALGDAPPHDDSAPWLNNDPEENSV